jgi:hypothetical protein
VASPAFPSYDRRGDGDRIADRYSREGQVAAAAAAEEEEEEATNADDGDDDASLIPSVAFVFVVVPAAVE